MTARDDFSLNTKRFVALRAGYLCSFTGCQRLTAGPSDESSSAVAVIGEAAHICAASPGGKRYDPSMSPEERSSIDNAIWMCAIHARLIDRDDVKYTAEDLRGMKRAHEVECAAKVCGTPSQSPAYDLFAIGPEVICAGTLQQVSGSEWSLNLAHFVLGDVPSLVAFIDAFPRIADGKRYVLVNEVGDGRVLVAAPVMTRTDAGYTVRCQVAPAFPRIDAQRLPTDWAISPTTNDLFAEKGRIAEVSGLAALPQKLRLCLSLQFGESPFHPDFGTRFAQYYEAFGDSPWLGQLLKLDSLSRRCHGSRLHTSPVRHPCSGRGGSGRLSKGKSITHPARSRRSGRRAVAMRDWHFRSIPRKKGDRVTPDKICYQE
jgi:hypothetical protein